MNYFKSYIEYLKDNPRGLWFKNKWFGWGWIPVRWQGWAVVAVAIGIAALGIYIGDTDDAPGAALIGILFAIALITFFGFRKGEKACWNWGDPRKK